MEYTLTFDQYQKGLEEGKLIGLKCNSCGIYTFPPKGVCRDCGSSNLSKTDIKGKGTIKTFTVIRVAPEGKTAPYIVAMIEIEEGAWVIGNLKGVDPDEASLDLIGKKVNIGSHVVAGDCYTGECRVLTFQLDP